MGKAMSEIGKKLVARLRRFTEQLRTESPPEGLLRRLREAEDETTADMKSVPTANTRSAAD